MLPSLSFSLSCSLPCCRNALLLLLMMMMMMMMMMMLCYLSSFRYFSSFLHFLLTLCFVSHLLLLFLFFFSFLSSTFLCFHFLSLPHLLLLSISYLFICLPLFPFTKMYNCYLNNDGAKGYAMHVHSGEAFNWSFSCLTSYCFLCSLFNLPS